ncbi:NCAM [Mytilus coruscus]|uniref:NCAM n=1 Tax=Mytilus coruscus TaxID=42192 RepID=A0A6J8CE73_MYTCO|nr:NCAM [Mytilus coruscus]
MAVLKTSKVRPVDTTVTEKLYIPYTQGLLLNPKLKHTNIDIIGNYISSECNLIIQNFSNDDVGIYRCEYWENGSIYIDTYVVNIQSKQVLNAAKDVFVRRYGTIALNCKCFYQNESTWRVLKTSKVRPVDTTVTEKLYIPYTQGLLLNPKLKHTNIDIIGNYISSECNLIIRNFSNDDVGIYRCEYWENGSIYIDTYVVNIQSPPVIKINHTITEQEIILLCNPSGGEPKNYTFDLWEHHSEFKEFIRSLKGTNADYYVEYVVTLLRFKSNNASYVFCGMEEKCINPIKRISKVAEVNIESVSSIIESNDIIPRADIVSSDDSSSTKQLGDGYENPYQAINPCDIEMHHYSSIINDNYQNTMIFSSESATNTPQHFNVAMNSFRQPSN